MITIKETQGDTLQGTIDGINTVYVASYDFFDDQRVSIFVNGRLKIREWEDGFTVVLPRTVILNEPLLVGDSLEVEYQSGIATGGGADGGCPSAPEIVILTTVLETEQDVPSAMLEELEPDTFIDSPGMDISLENLRPDIIMSEEG